jgi:hypothetical protein
MQHTRRDLAMLMQWKTFRNEEQRSLTGKPLVIRNDVFVFSSSSETGPRMGWAIRTPTSRPKAVHTSSNESFVLPLNCACGVQQVSLSLCLLKRSSETFTGHMYPVFHLNFIKAKLPQLQKNAFLIYGRIGDDGLEVGGRSVKYSQIFAEGWYFCLLL